MASRCSGLQAGHLMTSLGVRLRKREHEHAMFTLSVCLLARLLVAHARVQPDPFAVEL